MPYQDIDHRFLERSCNIRLIYRNSFHFTGIEVIKHCGFQAAEAEIVGTPVYFRTREYNGIRIAFFRYFIDFGTAGIAETDSPRHLIEGFARGIIPCPSDDFVLPVIFYHYKMGMSAGNHKADKRRLQILIFYKIGADMSFDMMDSDQRLVRGKRYGLCCGYSYQKRPHQAGAIGHCHSSHFL